MIWGCPLHYFLERSLLFSQKGIPHSSPFINTNFRIKNSAGVGLSRGSVLEIAIGDSRDRSAPAERPSHPSPEDGVFQRLKDKGSQG